MSDRLPDDPKTSHLVRRARNDPESFGALYSRVAPALAAWARAKIHPAIRSRIDPEDLIQEVTIAAFGGFSRYDDTRATFRAWLFGVAHHVLARVLRDVGRGRTLQEVALDASAAGRGVDALPDDVTTLSRRVARDEGLALFQARVDALDPEERRLLVDHGLEGCALAVVAERLGCSAEAAKKRWQRLRARLDAEGLPDLLRATIDA